MSKVKVLLVMGMLAAQLLSQGCSQSKEPTPVEAISDAFAELAQALQQEVNDPARQNLALEQLKTIEEFVMVAGAGVEDRRASLRALNLDYNAPRQAFDDLLVRELALQEARQTKAIELVRSLRGTLTTTEWQATADARNTAIVSSLAYTRGLP